MVFDESVWDKYFRGFTVFDVAIYRAQGYCFLLVEETPERDVLPATRVVTIVTDRVITTKNTPFAQTGNFEFSSIACSVDPPEYVVVDLRTKVYSTGATSAQFEDPIRNILDLSAEGGAAICVCKLVRIGKKIYAAGSDRRILRREGVDRWVDLRDEGLGVPLPADYGSPEGANCLDESLGFNDLSGFDETEIYAAGGEGDLWRLKDKQWLQCSIPTNVELEAVCCAGDGYVYVTDLHGNVWRGREDNWAQVATSNLAWGYQPKDAFWFKGRMYFGAQEGIYTIHDKQLVPLAYVDPTAPSSMVSGRIDISPDGNFLLTAGPYGACLYDGETWTRLFSAYDCS